MSPRGGFQFEFDPQSFAQGIQLFNQIFEPKASKQARQMREYFDAIRRYKPEEMAPEQQQQFYKAYGVAQPSPLSSLFGAGPEPIGAPPTGTTVRQRPRSFLGISLSPQTEYTLPSPERGPYYKKPPLQFPTKDEFDTARKGLMDLGYDEKEARDGAREILTGLKREKPSKTEVVRFGANLQTGALEQYHVNTETGEEIVGTRRPVWQAKETHAEKLAAHIDTLDAEIKGGYKQKPLTREEKRAEVDYKEKLRRERPEKPSKEPLPPGTDVQLRAALLRLYLTNSNMWIDKKAQEDAVIAVREGKLEDAYYLLNPDQQRTFEEVITIAEGYARKLGVTRAINQALHDLQSRRPSAFQRQGGPPALEPKREGAKAVPSQEDLEFTAKQHGITVEEVKKRLGVR